MGSLTRSKRAAWLPEPKTGNFLMRIVLAIGLLTAVKVNAQTVLEPVSSPFTERLTERVPVSGHVLAGLVSATGVQAPTGQGLQRGNVALLGPLAATAPLVCVRAISQDGRYSAENEFATGPGNAAAGRVELDWPSAYKPELSRFLLQEVALLARSGSCSDKADILPILLGPDPALGTLQVLVNTRGGAVTATLRDPETLRTLRRANCVRVEGAARVAFDARCVLGAATGLPPRTQLRLEQASRDGLQNEVLESSTLRLAD